jgi:hypothetical protein
MLVIIGPHSLNTLQARVIDMKLYCDDVMGGSTRSTRRRTPTLYTTAGPSSFNHTTSPFPILLEKPTPLIICPVTL